MERKIQDGVQPSLFFLHLCCFAIAAEGLLVLGTGNEELGGIVM